MDQRVQPLIALIGAGCVLLGLACGVGYKQDVNVQTVAESRRPHVHLVEYLAMTSADPIACHTMRNDGPAVRFVNRKVVRALNEGFEAGVIPEDRWQACLLHLWNDVDPTVQDALIGEVEVQLRHLVRHADLTTDVNVRARLYAALRTLDQRRANTPMPASTVHKLRKRVDARRADTPDGNKAAVLLDRVRSTLDLELGLHEGAPIQAADVARATDVQLLARWARRLPDPTLRDAAAEALIQQRVSASPFAWVRDNPERVQQQLNTHGYLPVQGAVTGSSWAPRATDPVMIRLLQNYKKGWTKLLPSAVDETRTPDASLDLRGSLTLRVDGLEQPITLCPGADPWDPTPCVPADTLSLRHPVARLAPTGRIRFEQDLSLDEVLKLGSDGERLSAQVVVGGTVQTIDMPIFFDSVPEMVHYGRSGAVPHMQVKAWELSNHRLLLEVKGRGALRTWRALVSMHDAAFRLGNVGDMHGPGGDVKIQLECTSCAEVRAWLKDRSYSRGGKDQPDGRVTVRIVKKLRP